MVENLKDYNRGENAGIDVSGVGVGKDTKTPIGQTGVQYGSHDKEQDTNATFVNTEVTEAGKKLNLEEMGINTDINKSQVITKDEVVEQIDTQLHTDMLNKTVRDDFMEDLLKTGSLVPEVVQGIKEGLTNEGETVLGQISNNMGERSDEIKAFVEGRDKKLEKELEKHKNEKGELVYNEETKNLITENILTTLDEFGKGKYEVIYVKGDANDPSMSINDEDGRVYININGEDFGDAESMRKTAQHEGGHGTYKDKNIDEKSAGKLGNNKGTTTKPNIVVDSNMNKELEAGQLAYEKDKEDNKLRDKIVLTPSKNDKKNSELVVIDSMITMLEIRYSEIKNDKNLSESEKKSEITKINNYLKGLEILTYSEEDINKIMPQLPPEGKQILNELKEVVKFNSSKKNKDYFSSIYESMTLDTLFREKDPKTGEEKIVVKKEVNLNNINDEMLKFTTQAIRDQIKSDIPIYLQIPSESQKNILGGSSELHASTIYTKTSEHNGIIVYFDNDLNAHNSDFYISGVESINGNNVKFDRNNYGTIINGKQTMKDSEIHEIIGHPTDYVRLLGEKAYLYDEKGKITGLDYSNLEFAGNPKIVVNPIDKNYVFVEKFAQEVKGKNGEILYYIPSVSVDELNPILLENMMRNKYNGNGKKNERIQYLNIDTTKSIIIKKDEFNKLFGK